MASVGIQGHSMGRNSLLNKHLKVAALHHSPLFIFYCDGREMKRSEVDECHDNGNITYGGILWNILKFVKHARNVTFSIVKHPTFSYGNCYVVNNCTGLIGMVNRKEVDFALGILLFHLP